MRCFFTLKEGFNKKIIGIVDLDGGVLRQLNLEDYKIKMILSERDEDDGLYQLREVIIEK